MASVHHTQTGSILLPVSNPSRAASLAATAARIALARSAPVIVLTIVLPTDPSLARLEGETGADMQPALQTALVVLHAAGVSARSMVRVADDVGVAIRQTIRELGSQLIVLGWRGEAQPDGNYLNAALAAVLEDPICDVVIVGGYAPQQLQRILVPVGGGPHSAFAFRLASELAGTSTQGSTQHVKVTALHVVPQDYHPRSTFISSARHLEQMIGDRLHDSGLVRKTVVANDTAQAILEEFATGYDAVLMGTSREALIDRLLFGDLPQRVAEESRATVIVVRRRTGFVTRVLRRAWHGIIAAMPALTPSERDEVRTVIREGARSRADFFVMVALAAILAGLGLLLNSPAVIIGAMLVAPLMTAIVGLGLGIVEGDTGLLRMAVWASARGILLAILIGALLGVLVPDAATTPEIMARTQPNVLDLGVALASGAAGAYALCRKSVSAALAGIAIAAALVPPLTTVGIGLALGRQDIAGGALLLFVTNLIAIAAASGLFFLLFGFAPPARHKTQRALLRRGLLGALMLLAAVTVILGILTTQTLRVVRLDRAIDAAIQAELEILPDTELVEVRRSQTDDGVLHLAVTLRSVHQFPHETALTFQRDIATRLQQPVALLLNVIPATRLDPLVPPTFTSTPTPTRTPTPGPTATTTFTPTPSPPPSPTLTPTATASASPSATATATALSTVTPTATPTTLPTPAPAVVVNTSGRGAWLRTTPGGSIAGAVTEGTAVFLLGEQIEANGRLWARVLIPRGLTGWIALDYLKLVSATR
ncbi:DUF389 domain-containing protein [Candidatus Amarolinea aalborgensis]|uniref:DUF389 domain-containing protein n=1 Tax=Candidatus Amarolinea aalborgensis TaxID=2249329 RepID=UPI003BFA1F61